MTDTNALKEFFNRLAPSWDQSCSHDPRKRKELVSLLEIEEGDRVLDIGCGTGVLERDLLLYGPASIAGVDLSDRMIELARRKISDSRVLFYAADIHCFEEAGFQRAVIYSAYPHFIDRTALARTVFRLLAPGGRFLVAHSEGRTAINGCHQASPESEALSKPLLPAREEAAHWAPWFHIDQLRDDAALYYFTGTKKRF